jgi:hypothetical protein
MNVKEKIENNPIAAVIITSLGIVAIIVSILVFVMEQRLQIQSERHSLEIERIQQEHRRELEKFSGPEITRMPTTAPLREPEATHQISSEPSTNRSIAGTTEAVNANGFIREVSTTELMDYLDPLPPLQKETIIRTSYIGRWVCWEGHVGSISSSGDGFAIFVTDDSSHAVAIMFSRDWQSQLEALRKNDLIKYKGKIEDIFGGVILSDGKLLQLGEAC